MADLLRTPLYGRHLGLGATLVDFGGWNMPVQYPGGIVQEHLATRARAGIFDVSHMGRFLIKGKGAIPFLQYVLTNNALALDPGMAQYTLIPNEKGGAVDDAYLYRVDEEGSSEATYLLVVNAANKEKDWDWLVGLKARFKEVDLKDESDAIGMVALQGPLAKKVLGKILVEGLSPLPDPWRNRLRLCLIEGNRIPVTVSRTGYTGEPICFELFSPAEKTVLVWEKILSTEEGIVPVGLGARDTLRLEAGLPLYGHELGIDKEGNEIPILAAPSAKMAVSFSSAKGDFVGKEALRRQLEEMKARADRRSLPPRKDRVLSRVVVPMAVLGQGIARQGYEVYAGEECAGHVTSGTMVPYWKYPEQGLLSMPSEERGMRPIALAYLDADLEEGQKIEVRQRGKGIEGIIVERHLSGEAPPYARPILVPEKKAEKLHPASRLKESAEKLIDRAVQNTSWRQKETINLIPSEQTPSPLVRLLTVMDPSHRYAEHRLVKALGERDVFYYQGTKMIEEVELLLIEELRQFLGCSEVEPRTISGQMANTAVFSGLMDSLNRTDRKSEPRRIRKVIHHHLGRGGHLSAQPMGALKDFIAVDPLTDRPAVVPFPVLKDDPYQIDLLKTKELIDAQQPELIVLGKSMILYREPVNEIARMISGMHPRPILMYDMAHVLGLIGPSYQEPFREGADIVTGSTHKTFFGPQRGLIGSNMAEGTEDEDLWQAIIRRVFPGSVSNHHLGTLLGLLLAAYEMNAFKGDYQKAVVSNARAFARALKTEGLQVEGNPDVGFTETHQVIVRVGYGKGPQVAERLEENNIIVNYQAAPDDEGFTTASCLRMGVQEMTRFGMEEKDFAQLAEYISQVVLHGRSTAAEVSRFRSRFTALKYCLSGKESEPLVRRLEEAMA